MSTSSSRSLLERLLGVAVCLLVAAVLLHLAVELLLSILWPLVGIAGVVAAAVVAWRVWRWRRGTW